ncbi:MAG: hypothetical protein ACK5DD_09790, partial [Cyclobacteriaceae bacterium]
GRGWAFLTGGKDVRLAGERLLGFVACALAGVRSAPRALASRGALRITSEYPQLHILVLCHP